MLAYFDVFIKPTGMASAASGRRSVSYSDIRQKWDEVVAHVKIDRVMKPYIESNIDACGVEVCLQAFQCVHEVLDKEGHVRRLNPRGESDLVNVCFGKSAEGPWKSKCSDLRWKWDWSSNVHRYRDNVVKEAGLNNDTSWYDPDKKKSLKEKPRWRTFTPLERNSMEQYCTIVVHQNREALYPPRPYRVFDWKNENG